MPQVFNINPPIRGLNINIRSVRCWFWPMPNDKSTETTVDTSHFVEFEGFPQNNANGASLGVGSVDTDGQTAMQAFQATTVQELLQAAFGD